MDSEQQEQAFDAIYMAVLLSRQNVARRVFDNALELYCHKKVEPVLSRLAVLAQKLESAEYSPASYVIMQFCAFELMDIIEELNKK